MNWAAAAAYQTWRSNLDQTKLIQTKAPTMCLIGCLCRNGFLNVIYYRAWKANERFELIAQTSFHLISFINIKNIKVVMFQLFKQEHFL